MTDPIADLLTRIRNAGLRKIEVVEVPHSNVKETIVEILAKEKFIDGYEVITDPKTGFKVIRLRLRYAQGKLAIQHLSRISKPGIRRYVGYSEIPRVLGGVGICVVSTSKGMMTGQEAKKNKIGGELICTIY